MQYLFIALVASLGWLVKDWIHQGKTFSLSANWKKYVGCFAGGALYGILSGLKFFQWIAIVAVIALIANSFSDVITFLNWVLVKIGVKAKL